MMRHHASQRDKKRGCATPAVAGVVLVASMASSTARKNEAMALRYEPKADVFSVEYHRRKPIEYVTEIGNLIVHFSQSGDPVLIEILNASHFTTRAHALTHRRVRRRGVTRARMAA